MNSRTPKTYRARFFCERRSYNSRILAANTRFRSAASNRRSITAADGEGTGWPLRS